MDDKASSPQNLENEEPDETSSSSESLENSDNEEGESSDEDDEVQYCDCIAAVLYKTLPGTPGRKGIIPYTSIYETQSEARKRGYWIPGVPVNAKIIKVEKNKRNGLHFFNTFLYTIELEHGNFKWKVVRNYEDFMQLNNRLQLHRAAEKIIGPVRKVQEHADSLMKTVGLDVIPDHKEDCPYYKERTMPPEQEAINKRKLSCKKKHHLPPFPKLPEAMVINVEHRKDQLEKWLQMILHIPINRNHHETAEFVEISRFSFVNDLGGKHTEGFVKKRPGGSRVYLGCKQCCVRYLVPWGKRWLMVRDSFVAYMDHKTEQIRMVLLMDKDFKVVAGGREADGIPTGLIITNTQHKLHLKCSRIQDTQHWKNVIEQAMSGLGNIWIQPHRFSSSFPVRENCYGKWFVDARSYMTAAADMMELAREEIFIADWWLSPEIYMKRPALAGIYWRLDQILKRKAEQGVKIFILLYKELEIALGLNSMYTKRTLQSLHQNIKVMRHPDHYPSTGTFFWAHHEKLVVIDQLIAFVGGIDLCFGRWDDEHHLLTDLGSVQFVRQHNLQDRSVRTGLRALVRASLSLSEHSLEDGDNGQQSEIPFSKMPRCSRNPKQSRMSKIISNWKINKARRKLKQVLENDKATAAYELDWLKLQAMAATENVESDGGTKFWIGKDYVNYIHKDFIQVDLPFHDFVDRGITPRMPWHDIHSVTFGVPARDIARHFIQRWNATKTEKLKNDISYPFLLPKSNENVKVPLVFRNPVFSENVNIQVLRSLSNWSGLINKTENSIQNAYISLIANSKHYVYIENQFFVSIIDSTDVQNDICNAIFNRIIRAYKEKSKFRVYIMIPLLPGFEGDVGVPGGSALQAVLHHTYRSLCRGPNSLIERLKTIVTDPFEYLCIGSLRTHDLLCGKLVTELIYIHSKLLIVDDEYVIIGSANINDRSQVGNRDSEVCLLFQDINRVKSQMDGQPYHAGKFAKSLRIRCMKEHLGLLPNERRPAKFPYNVTCDDPISDEFFTDIWQATAKMNTRIYEEVFRACPTDNVETFEEYQRWKLPMCLAECQPSKAKSRLRELRGKLVEFPLNFLCKAILTPGITSKEGFVPSTVFT